MPAADLAAFIASLPPLRFIPEAEAGPAPCYLIVYRGDWALARRTAKGWAHNDGMMIDDPPYCAPLPALAPAQAALETLVCRIADDKATRHDGDCLRLTGPW
jgi:hypothetical protein